MLKVCFLHISDFNNNKKKNTYICAWWKNIENCISIQTIKTQENVIWKMKLEIDNIIDRIIGIHQRAQKVAQQN